MKSRKGDRDHVFLFVNKDSTSKSLSRNEGISAKEINRHAQQVRSRRLAAQKATSALTSSSSARRIAVDGWKRRNDSTVNGVPSPPSSTEHSAQSPLPISERDSNVPTPGTTSPPSSESPQSPGSPAPESPEHNVDPEPSSRTTGDVGTQPPGSMEVIPAGIVETSTTTKPGLALPYSMIYKVDPFNQLPRTLTEHIHIVLQHAVKLYAFAGNNYKLAYLPKHIRSSINQFPIQQVVRDCVHHEHHLYAILAAISMRMKTVFCNILGGETPESYKKKASHNIRKELLRSAKAGAVDAHTILDILFLIVSEMGANEWELARSHLEVVGKLYCLLDISKNFDFWVSETAAHVDNQLAIYTGQRPLLPSTFDPGPMLPERMAAIKREVARLLMLSSAAPEALYPRPMALAVAAAPSSHTIDAIADLALTLDVRMGRNFEMALERGVYDHRLSPILKDLIDCVAIAKVVWLSPMAVCYDAEWLCRKARAVMRSLLKLAPENNIGPLDVIGKCMEPARLSLLIVMSHACTLIGFQTASTNTARLRAAMSYALEFWGPFVGVSHECAPIGEYEPSEFVKTQLSSILYGSMVGLFGALNTKHEEYFSVRAINICRWLAITNAEDLRDHMACFIYSKSLQEESVERIGRRLETTQGWLYDE